MQRSGVSAESRHIHALVFRITFAPSSSCQPECLNLLTLLSQAPCKISSHPRTEKPSAFPLSPCMRACAFQDPHAHRVLFSATAVQAARQSPIHPGWLLFSRQDGGRSRGFFWGRWWKRVPSLNSFVSRSLHQKPP